MPVSTTLVLVVLSQYQTMGPLNVVEDGVVVVDGVWKVYIVDAASLSTLGVDSWPPQPANSIPMMANMPTIFFTTHPSQDSKRLDCLL